MRPLELELAGFRSYDRETVDWREHGLVVISGDTGAGKTSLLDAISYALYARTPEGARPRDLLTLGRERGEVRLTFTMDGERWRVTRRYGRDVPDPGHLLERLGHDGAAAERAVGEAAVNARLVELLGMGFEAFTSAVLLAQGRFSQFLSADPRGRDAILREIFGVSSLEGARPAAIAARDAAEREAAALGEERGRLARHGAAERAGAARRARAAAARAAALRALVPAAERMARESAAAAAGAERAGRLAAALAALPDRAARAALAERLAEAGRLVAAAESEHARAARALAAAREARDAARLRHGGTAADLAAQADVAERVRGARAALPDAAEALAAARRALSVRQREAAGEAAVLDAARAEHEARAGRLVALEEELRAEAAAAAAREREAAARGAWETGAKAAARAEAEAEAAGAALEDARRHDAADHLRAGLHPGDACPVCGAMVLDERTPSVPLVSAAQERRRAARAAAESADRALMALASALGAAGEARAEAEARLAAARAAAGGPGRGAAEAAALRDALEREAPLLAAREAQASDAARAAAARAWALDAEAERIARAREALGEDEARLGALAAAEDPAAEVRAAVAALRAAEEALDPVAAAERACAARLRDRVAERDARERGEVAALRGAAARLAECLGAAAAPGTLPAGEVGAACDALERRAARARRDAEARAAAARETAERLAAELERRGAPAGEPAAVERLAAAAAAERAEARRALAEVEAVAARARALTVREGAARAAAAVHARVAQDLQANRFPRYLLQRYRGRLAAGASARLQELTAGAYRFAGTEPDPLAVVDMRRGERTRAASTLSGGERFLASLALALGLSDVAAESGGRLDCLFLDEGFSTLDAESLEQAMCGVERLAGDGRLIGVITHLPGVAERLGAAIRVAKDAEGVSRVVRGAAPAPPPAPAAEPVPVSAR